MNDIDKSQEHMHCCHGHNHSHQGHHHTHMHGHHSEGNILTAFFLNIFFAIIELVGGIYTGSVAIMSDALHDFGDSISLGIAWRLQKLSKKGRDATFTYGYKRFALLGALLISILLLVGSVFVIIASVERLIDPSEPKAKGMLILAIFGVIINGAAVLRLRLGHSLSERAVMLHMLEDVLGWIAVLIVSLVMMFVKVPILDPILSLCITMWILYNVYRNLRESFKILLQGVPTDVDRAGLETKILEIPNVCSVHDIHLWTLDGESHIMTIHVVYRCNKICTPETIAAFKREIRDVAAQYHIEHLTIELDPENTSCSLENC
ncbi:cation diffusion facilitator family transporter [Porphyromonas pogonae]|uniref:cation diffusion facilitator family transporter n=1 Tax=Porphyromonas pogonae TaxID=867595 RepID=UPI002E76476F|nr:cation diffusion facilitator family transporter [Porphyromonas pogonae]